MSEKQETSVQSCDVPEIDYERLCNRLRRDAKDASTAISRVRSTLEILWQYEEDTVTEQLYLLLSQMLFDAEMSLDVHEILGDIPF